MSLALRVLIAGDWHSELHEEPIYQALKNIGHDPIRFAWHEYFNIQGVANSFLRILLRLQNKYMLGLTVNRLNRDLIEMVSNSQPDVVFIYRGTHIYARTLQLIREAAPRAVIVGFNNDDPFSPLYPWWKWRHFLAGVPKHDLMLAFRRHNVDELKAAGAKRVELFRHWFIPGRNYPVQLTCDEHQKYSCDVVFIGHYEDDGRVEYLEEVVRRGWRLRIYGHGHEWDSVLRRSSILNGYAPVRSVWGEEYNLALCGAKVALCFFSKLNRDTYTTRCFEIPASGTVLVSEYSEDLTNIFQPGVEAVYFKDVSEMCARLEWVLLDDTRRAQIAKAGTERVWMDGHDVTSRVKTLLGWLEEIRAT